MPIFRAPFALLVATLACGPEAPVDPDWMLGLYSREYPGQLDHNVNSGRHYEIRSDGTFVVTGTHRCGTVELPRENHTWKRVADDAIEVQFTGSAEERLPWRITPGADCNEILVQQSTETDSYPPSPIVRGAVCVRPEQGCTEGECFCETYWCDEPPPACDDAP